MLRVKPQDETSQPCPRKKSSEVRSSAAASSSLPLTICPCFFSAHSFSLLFQSSFCAPLSLCSASLFSHLTLSYPSFSSSSSLPPWARLPLSPMLVLHLAERQTETDAFVGDRMRSRA
ncbi:hypothetical protein AMECASPLE_015902 [Ameca splendens]|uniref:Transmembrane protein n=1 Tax=Ameca splendens TaxID=208324 RepID=A0ABV0XQW5_9TELE